MPHSFWYIERSEWQRPQYSTAISTCSSRSGPGLNSYGSNFAPLPERHRRELFRSLACSNYQLFLGPETNPSPTMGGGTQKVAWLSKSKKIVFRTPVRRKK